MTINNLDNDYVDNDLKTLERLYDLYSMKVFGFITNLTDSKEVAEEFLINVFLKVWDDIRSFESNTDNRIKLTVLLVCKPLYYARISK